MTDAELQRLLFSNPELQVATEPDARPMPDAAKEWLAADKAKLAAKFVALWNLCGGPELWPEYQFDDIRRWRFDFYVECNGMKIGIEINGGVFSGGRHVRGKGYLRDLEKMNAAQMHGIVVFQLGTSQIDIEHVSEIVDFTRQERRNIV